MNKAIAVKIYNLKGEATGEVKLPAGLFGKKIKNEVVHQVVVAEAANSRQVIAHTKDRSEVRGGGKKPWRQKGTGRSRHGSIRSPLWKGGGVTFGPRKNRNFTKKINKKMARAALAMILSDRVKDNHFLVIDELKLIDLKTKHLVSAIKKLPVKNSKFTLLLSRGEKKIKQAAENLPQISLYKADSVNASVAIKRPYIVVSQDGLKEILAIHKNV